MPKISNYDLAEEIAADDCLVGVDVSDETMSSSGSTRRFRVDDFPISAAAKTALALKSEKAGSHYPYVVDWVAPDTTSDLTIDFNDMTVMFDHTQVAVSAWSYTFTASKITNVWVSEDGTVSYEECDPDQYTTLTRYTDRMMVAEVTTGTAKVVAVYFRGETRKVTPAPSMRPANLDEVFINYYIKPYTVDWDEVAVEYGDVIKTSDGYLYYCIKGGTLDASEPSTPTYSYELNSGFHEQTSGTAVIVYIGRDTYEGAFRPAYMTGINWYFANLGIGWLAKSGSPVADELADQMLNHIRCAINRAIRPWQASTSYYYGMLIVDTSTGYVWQCQGDGTSDSSASFPSSPTVGTTEYTDNDITWLCFGLTYTGAVWQLGDTNVTMDEFKAPDSHDSYAATLMWALEQLRAAGYVPDDFFTETSEHGITYVAAMREIIYYNLLVQMENNLARTFQDNIVPDGSGDTYAIQFLMDNCEVYAGLAAAYDFYSDERYTVDTTYPAYVSAFMTTVITGLKSLWDDDEEVFAYYLGYDPANNPDTPLFYPWIMSQAWPSLWDTPVDYYMIRAGFQYMETAYPDWWQSNNIDDLAALGAHVGLYKFNPTRLIKGQILNRIEVEKMLASASELYLMDFGYYHYLKEASN